MTETASDRVRRRLRDELGRRNLNQTDIAGMLGWTQSRVSKILNGKIQLGLDELASLCFVLNLSLTEAVRDQGLEFCADMTPTELRMLERLRELPKPARDAMLTILHVRRTTTEPDRYAKPKLKPARRG